MITKLYLHIKKGTAFKPGLDLPPDQFIRADYITLANGDAVGVVCAHDARARTLLESTPGITVLPALHRTLDADHADAFSHANVSVGESGHDAVDKLYALHRIPWLHPENDVQF
jgi:hypothetical protein